MDDSLEPENPPSKTGRSAPTRGSLPAAPTSVAETKAAGSGPPLRSRRHVAEDRGGGEDMKVDESPPSTAVAPRDEPEVDGKGKEGASSSKPISPLVTRKVRFIKCVLFYHAYTHSTRFVSALVVGTAVGSKKACSPSCVRRPGRIVTR